MQVAKSDASVFWRFLFGHIYVLSGMILPAVIFVIIIRRYNSLSLGEDFVVWIPYYFSGIAIYTAFAILSARLLYRWRPELGYGRYVVTSIVATVTLLNIVMLFSMPNGQLQKPEIWLVSLQLICVFELLVLVFTVYPTALGSTTSIVSRISKVLIVCILSLLPLALLIHLQLNTRAAIKLENSYAYKLSHLPFPAYIPALDKDTQRITQAGIENDSVTFTLDADSSNPYQVRTIAEARVENIRTVDEACNTYIQISDLSDSMAETAKCFQTSYGAERSIYIITYTFEDFAKRSSLQTRTFAVFTHTLVAAAYTTDPEWPVYVKVDETKSLDFLDGIIPAGYLDLENIGKRLDERTD